MNLTNIGTVLLFGMPRSGTTWVGKLFDSHPDTLYLHEPDSVEANYAIPLLMNAASADQQQLGEDICKWLQSRDEKVIASRPFFDKSYMNFFQMSVFLATAYGCKVSQRIGLAFLDKPVRLQSKPPLTVWKSIESLGRLPAMLARPDYYGIHIIRHPCGQIASTLRGEKTRQFAGAITTAEDWDLFEKLLEQSGESRFTLEEIRRLSPEERLAIRWGIINDFALRASANSNFGTLVYEELCSQPLEKLREVFSTVGLQLGEETRKYVSESTGGEDSGYYATRKTPLISAYKWKKELSSDQRERIRNIVSHFQCAKFYLNDFDNSDI